MKTISKILFLLFIVFSFPCFGQSDSVFVKETSQYVKANYVNGKPEGAMVIYDSLGRKTLDCFYVNGKLQGMYIIYFNGIKSSECEYNNGIATGEFKSYNKTGVLIYENKVVAGKVIYTKCWDDNGRELKDCSQLHLNY